LLINVGCEKAVALIKRNLKLCGVNEEFCMYDNKLCPSFFQVLVRNPLGGRRIPDEGWFVDVAVLCAMGAGGDWMKVATRISSCAGGKVFDEDIPEIAWLYKPLPTIVDEVDSDLIVFEENDKASGRPDVDVGSDEVSTWVEAAQKLVEMVADKVGPSEESLVHENGVTLCENAPVQARVIIELLQRDHLPHELEKDWPTRRFGEPFALGREGEPYRIRVVRSECGKCLYPAHCEFCGHTENDGVHGKNVFIMDLVRGEHLDCTKKGGRYIFSHIAFEPSYGIMISHGMWGRFGDKMDAFLSGYLQFSSNQYNRWSGKDEVCLRCAEAFDTVHNINHANQKMQYVAFSALRRVGLDDVDEEEPPRGDEWCYKFKQCWCRYCSITWATHRQKPWLLSWAGEWYEDDYYSQVYGRPKVLFSWRQTKFKYGSVLKVFDREWWSISGKFPGDEGGFKTTPLFDQYQSTVEIRHGSVGVFLQLVYSAVDVLMPCPIVVEVDDGLDDFGQRCAAGRDDLDSGDVG